MPNERGDIAIHMGPPQQEGPDSLLEPIVVIDKAKKKLQIAVRGYGVGTHKRLGLRR